MQPDTKDQGTTGKVEPCFITDQALSGPPWNAISSGRKKWSEPSRTVTAIMPRLRSYVPPFVSRPRPAWPLAALAVLLGAAGGAAGQPLIAPPVLAAPGAPPAAPLTEDVLPLPATAPPAGGAGQVLPDRLQEIPSETLPLPGDDLAITMEEPAAWYSSHQWLGPTPWETSIEFGLNGSSGTSDSLSIRAGGHVLRESRFSKLDLETTYNRTTDGGSATQNNAQFDVRNDWLLHEESPWTLYATGNVFYDEFQAFDLQTSANTGVGYRFIHGPTLDLIARFGGGASREFGGPDDRWVPESLLGAEYTQRVATLHKVSAKVDYYPEWEEIGEFRLIAEAGWEIALVQPSNVSLKLSATDRYDSTPSGARPHLVNYSVLLLIKL
jgi:hypothetical protein